ncbi:MAG: DUF3617 domain-containing protein [Betaproteobacteria bacterium]|nr:DUF3617 domain-containing protein [Betaproteobacteria bacterium]
MFARTLVTIAVALAASTPLQTLAASFNAKPGAWQMSMNTLIVGNPLPPDVLATMPPEKRAKVEKAMKERAAKPVTLTHKICVTQENLDQDRIIQADKDDGKCTRKVVSRTETRLVMEQTCPEPHASTSQMTIEAKTPESLSANIVRVRGDGKGKVLVDIKGFWLGPNCAGIKDDD